MDKFYGLIVIFLFLLSACTGESPVGVEKDPANAVELDSSTVSNALIEQALTLQSVQDSLAMRKTHAGISVHVSLVDNHFEGDYSWRTYAFQFFDAYGYLGQPGMAALKIEGNEVVSVILEEYFNRDGRFAAHLKNVVVNLLNTEVAFMTFTFPYEKDYFSYFVPVFGGLGKVSKEVVLPKAHAMWSAQSGNMATDAHPLRREEVAVTIEFRVEIELPSHHLSVTWEDIKSSYSTYGYNLPEAVFVEGFAIKNGQPLGQLVNGIISQNNPKLVTGLTDVPDAIILVIQERSHGLIGEYHDLEWESFVIGSDGSVFLSGPANKFDKEELESTVIGVTLISAFIDVEYIDNTARERAVAEFKFSIHAPHDDILLPKSVRENKEALAFIYETQTDVSYQSICYVSGTSADEEEENGVTYYEVQEGETETFSITCTVTTRAAGIVSLALTQIKWTTYDKVVRVLHLSSDFQTAKVALD